ncbi:3-isopropylmalate dehydratase small subunit [Aneurinibacillus uraniidurans]|uniref:3-isopropylmalate dehydratase small subunit n=1 Tax=Aneurinibacillus uraniidurans TaxID=2966586 RepID=UPI00234A356F|nr:3-isopropylmalate dehydratase small subunit [Aneurinibacillus sp. B1]WCN39395.1 3-isopropylmalate dehydratase small subunit [Aneurinibacillus sp. B1]
MEPFKSVTSVVSPLDRVNVDTDAIIPKQFLKRIERTGFGQFLFYEWRFDEQENVNPDFELNKPRYSGSQILIARNNFGCGSSREHAPWALLDYGFKVVIAPSFADIFHNNCFKNGILPIVLPEETVDQLFKNTATEGYELTVDLEANTISDKNGLVIPFQVNEYRRHCLLNGLDDIGITLQQEDKIAAYEANYPSYYQTQA